MTAPVERPPVTLYEVRTRDGMAYRAEGDVIEQGNGWFTLWAPDMTLALRLPEAAISVVFQPDPEDLADPNDALSALQHPRESEGQSHDA